MANISTVSFGLTCFAQVRLLRLILTGLASLRTVTDGKESILRAFNAFEL